MFLGVDPSRAWNRCDYKPNLDSPNFLICSYFDSAILLKTTCSQRSYRPSSGLGLKTAEERCPLDQQFSLSAKLVSDKSLQLPLRAADRRSLYQQHCPRLSNV